MKEVLISTILKKNLKKIKACCSSKTKVSRYEKEQYVVCAIGIAETELQSDAAEIPL